MTTTISPAEVERFRRSIVQSLGLQFDDTKLGFLAEVLGRRLDVTRRAAHDYLAQLDVKPSSNELSSLAQELTVAETYFFRHAEQYRAFADVTLPERWRTCQSTGARLSILSAGCASGEEPYSLAMTVRDTLAHEAAAVSIRGIDINPVLLERAARGRFSPWALRETPPDVRQRWFQADGRELVLNSAARGAVRFDVCNLADAGAELWRPDSHDIVFCRNVLMYFAPATAQSVVSRFARALRPGGYLFLGHAETLRGLSNDFHLRHTHGTFYYQRKDHAEISSLSGAAGAQGLSPTVPVSLSAPSQPLSECFDLGSTWLDTIRQASERIRSLVDSPSHSELAGAVDAPSRPRPIREIGPALELLKEERFEDALAMVKALPADAGQDAEVILLRSALLTHSGQLAAAEEGCRRLLEINELNAEAHYLLALCREGAGDQAGSLHHDQVAIYLDPSFAMAHLHIGLLARRARDLGTARRELQQAIALLEREQPSRLLLFGGGFTREALVALCRAELIRSGGQV